ncbi:MAG: MFS transporter [Microbacterium sp.]|nr:MFS transporter [Microbacterium sp.]
MTHRQIMLVIFGLMAGMFLSSLDQTVVSTAIRTIGDDLNGLDQQAWVTTAYLITSTIMVPIYGKLSDIFGRRPIYIFGIVMFIVGSLLSAFSTSMEMLAGFRALQGIGAGALMSVPLAIMGDILAPRERAKYQGLFLAVFGVSAVIGPLIGGVFAGADQILWIPGWRWVFLLNVPVGLIALGMVLVFLHLPKIGDDHGHPRIDWWGATAVVVALVPMLLVAEEGQQWGWGSAGAIACYVLSAIGLTAFLLIERAMRSDAIIPLKLFRSGAFSMSTLLGFLVGFGMFGAMMTIPLYLQIVLGLSPTNSGFAMLPMVGGMMISSISSGLLVSRTGRYRIFPVIGTACVGVGYLLMTRLAVDTPIWYLATSMIVIGVGLGMIMQSLTLATQNAVPAADMGVATSSATFFRQIGGTLGAAVMLSILFAVMPQNIATSMSDRSDLTAALDAAMTPSVASDPANAAVMKQIWTPIVTPIEAQVAQSLDAATTQVTDAAKAAVTQQVTAAVQAQVAAGAVPADQASAVIDAQVAAALPAATTKALDAAATKAGVSVVDGKLAVDYTDAAQRQAVVDKAVPAIEKKLSGSTAKATGGGSSISDTSFLIGADAALTRPFLTGFTASTITIYWVGFIGMLGTFVLTLFFKAPPLRQRSALQERADAHAEAQVSAT